MGRSFLVSMLAMGAVAVVACTGDDPVIAPPSDGSGGGDTTAPPAVDPPKKSCTTGADCRSGLCVDGYCCNRACTEPCEACNVAGKEGTCSFVTGAPVGERPSCAGSGPCAGSCNGKSAECVYPSDDVICGAACDGKCDGAGGCTSVTGGSCPGGYACGATACLTSCTTDDDCQPFFRCEAAACVRIPESDCLDGKDNNGDGLADCSDPTCDDAVECVPAPSVGGELGLFEASGACPAEYGAATTWHSGLQSSPCTGCSCTSTCKTTPTIWSNDNECTAGGTTVTLEAAPQTRACKNVTATRYVLGTTTSPTVGGCIGTGTPRQADPTWTTTMTFCGARASTTCSDPAKRCVAKTDSKRCARGSQADACPSGYADDRGIFYSGYTPGSCVGSCASCTPATTLTCTQLVAAHTDSGCTGASSLIDTTCGTLNRGDYRSVGVHFFSSGTDNCKNDVTTVPPTPTGATRICCQP